MANISTFLQEQLQLSENVRFTATISKKPLLAYLIITIVLSIVFMNIGVFGIVLMIVLILSMLFQCLHYFIYSISSEFVITNQRVIGKVGFISRNTVEIPIELGEGLSVRQTILGRILNYGTILTSGTGSSSVAILFIEDPFLVRKKVLEARLNTENTILDSEAVVV